jgi:YVTN family beta-propeller protein
MKLKWRSLLIVAALCACSSPTPPISNNTASGSLALSTDESLLYAADTDNGLLGVIDLKSSQLLATVKVGVRPYRVAVGADDTIYVANRGSRSVSVIHRGDWKESAQLPTGVDPVGLAVSLDGRTLYVVSATARDTSDYGVLTAFDTGTLNQKFELNLGDEPRGIALVGGNRAVITLFRAGDLITVDLDKQQIVQSGTNLYAQANVSGLNPDPTTSYARTTPVTFHPRAMTDIAVTPDGSRVFSTAMWDREAPIGRMPDPTVGYYGAGGPCSFGAIASAGLVTADVGATSVDPKVDDVSVAGCTSYGYGVNPNSDANYPISSLAVPGVGALTTSGAGSSATPVQGPSAVAVDGTGDWVFLVNRESSNVAILPANRRQARVDDSSAYADFGSAQQSATVHSVIPVGAGADGIALTHDGNSAYVYSQFQHRVERLALDSQHKNVINTGVVAVVAQDTLDAVTAEGRRMFYDATDRRLSSLGASVACSSCHLEGRDDSHVWNFPDGPRQTPTLAGRGVPDTAPYHWSGEFPDLAQFLDHTVRSRMGGSGLDVDASKAISQFMANVPAPENPNVGLALTDAQTRGEAVFQSAGCTSCHMGQWFNAAFDRDVGTLVTSGVDPDNGVVTTNPGFNVPSLRGLARSAPYLHDGSATTLEARLANNPGDRHGITSNLTKEQMSDLVAYLKTL